jgi:DNA-directed RNA polymerase subunit RPC12/RpoP
MKIICLSCGHKVELGDAYDDYAGQVKCVTCGAILEIKTEAGNLRCVVIAQQGGSAAASASSAWR